MDWALLVAALALGFSIFAFFRQSGLQTRVTKIEEARRQEEVASRLNADVTVFVERDPRPGSAIAFLTFLVLHNRGPAVATEVDFDVTEPGWHVSKDEADLPITTLDSDQRFRIPAFVTDAGRPTANVHIRWRDGTGARSKTLPVRLG